MIAFDRYPIVPTNFILLSFKSLRWLLRWYQWHLLYRMCLQGPSILQEQVHWCPLWLLGQVLLHWQIWDLDERKLFQGLRILLIWKSDKIFSQDFSINFLSIYCILACNVLLSSIINMKSKLKDFLNLLFTFYEIGWLHTTALNILQDEYCFLI